MPGQNPQQTIPPGIPALIAIGQFQQQPTFLLDRLSVVIGDKEGSDLQLLSGGVAPAHALIITAIDGVYVRNLTGQADLLVNGQPILIHRFVEGDLLQIAQFTFKFWANQAIFQPPMAPVPAAIECNGVWPIQMRIPLLGSRPGIDLHIEDASISACHAAIFAAGGAWHIRDLNSQAGVLIDNAKVRQAKLQAGNIVRVGNVQMRWLTEAQAKPLPASPPPVPAAPVGDGGLVLGGMPVSLPEVAPPQGFGKVGVSFEGQSLAQRIAPKAQVPGPTLPDLAAIENRVVLGAGGAADADALPTVRTPVLRNFPPVPKLRPIEPDEGDRSAGAEGSEDGGSGAQYFSARADFGMEISGGTDPSAFSAAVSSPAAMRDAFGGGEGLQTEFVSDAAFGGQALTGDATYFVPDFQEDGSEPYAAEIEDFSENKFWDLTDEQQLEVPLPQRETDLTPAIPPVIPATGGIVADPIGAAPALQMDAAGGAAMGEGIIPSDVFGKMPTDGDAADPVESRSARAKAPPAQEYRPLLRPIEGSSRAEADEAPTNGAGRYVRRAGSKAPIGAMAAAVIIGMAATAGIVYWLTPARSVVEGRLSFVNVPSDGMPDRQALEDDQRRRLADASLADTTVAAFLRNHPNTGAGFLRDSAQFNSIVAGAHFENQGTS
ncbi:MAG: FHA domain-containing protein, partial [Tepidisphaeraceae bacterium]